MTHLRWAALAVVLLSSPAFARPGEVAKNQRESRQDRRQHRDDRRDLLAIERIQEKYVAAGTNAAALARVEAELEAHLKLELQEGRKERRQDKRELRGSRREVRRDGTLDDARDRRDDRRDLAVEDATQVKRRNVATQVRALYGKFDAASVTRKKALIDELVSVAVFELGQDRREKREDRRERREDRRSSR